MAEKLGNGLDLRRRLRTFIGIWVVVLSAAYFAPHLLMCGAMLATLDEYHRITTPNFTFGSRLFHLLLSAASYRCANLFGVFGLLASFFFILLCTFAVFITTALQVQLEQDQEGEETYATLFDQACLCLFGHAYITIAFGHVQLLYYLRSQCSMLCAFYSVWITGMGETAALVVGGFWGTSRSGGKLSPHKTREGFLAQLFSSVVLSCCHPLWMPTPQLSLNSTGAWALCGLCVGSVGILGDLTGSLLKRALRRKDTGNILPGVGGLLDRFDGNSFTFATVFYISILAEHIARPDPWSGATLQAGLTQLTNAPFECPTERTGF
eukprot:gb/GEZN01012998.1/.p1 GENE.gb/GEZN01012998.1/~~gb/GEZN01012998.1/.p1  ORF type:complete len:323 (-),score=32.38 gb/GEZN01012998.1/:12-980(-)